MIKDVFTLKKSAWHCKMMKYIWGFNHYDFNHMCPYWWLSVFNFIIFIPFFTVKEGFKLLGWCFKILGKMIGFGFKLAWKLIVAWEDRQERIWRENKEKRNKEYWARRAQYFKEHPQELVSSEGKIYDKILAKIRQFHYSEWVVLQENVREVRDTVQRTLEEQKMFEEAEEARKRAAKYLEEKRQKFFAVCFGPKREELLEKDTWQQYLDTYEEREKARKEQEEYDKKLRAAAMRQEAKAKIVRLMKVIKPVMTYFAYALGSAAVLVGAYYLIKGIMWCVDKLSGVKIHINWPNVWHWTGIIGAWTGLILFVAVVVFGLHWLIARHLKKTSEQRNNLWYEKHMQKAKRDLEAYRRNQEAGEKISKVAKATRKPFKWFWRVAFVKPAKAIRSAFQFLGAMFKENCPSIEWKD